MASISDFSKRPLAGFFDQLGSSASAPGGGSAAALTGAAGVALLEMVARLNAERETKKAGKPTAAAKPRILKLEKIKKNLLSLVTQDAKVFMKSQKDFKEEKSSARYQDALMRNMQIPLEICSLCVEAMALGVQEKPRTGKWLASDLSEAGILLLGAFGAGRLNVEVNLKSLRDRALSSAAIKKMNAYSNKLRALESELSGAAPHA